jgi:hypothetical protein
LSPLLLELGEVFASFLYHMRETEREEHKGREGGREGGVGRLERGKGKREGGRGAPGKGKRDKMI